MRAQPSSANVTYRKLSEGFPPLSAAIADAKLTRWERVKLEALTWGLGLYGPLLRRIRQLRGKPQFDLLAGTDGLHGMKNHSRGTRRHVDDSDHYLTEDEVAEFERTGIAGPYQLLDADTAAEFKASSFAHHDTDWNNKIYIGADTAAALKRHDSWTITESGLYQALQIDEQREIIERPEIAHRLASLLGDDILAWRSQFFDVDAHAAGTFWHQASTFAEDGPKSALGRPGDVPWGMVQLSMWLALEDVTIRNGCLRFLPGSFADGRLDRVGKNILADPIGFLSSLDRRARREAITTMLFIPGSFTKAQMGFNTAFAAIPDLFDGCEPVDLEMKAGEFILFSSLNLHGSRPNDSDTPRLAFGCRYTSGEVELYPGQTELPFRTPEGTFWFAAADVPPIVVHSADD
jgi:chlorinating enzyme